MYIIQIESGDIYHAEKLTQEEIQSAFDSCCTIINSENCTQYNGNSWEQLRKWPNWNRSES